MGKREPFALLNLSSWCLVMVERLFLEVQWGCLRFVIVVFPDHTHLLFLRENKSHLKCFMINGIIHYFNYFVLAKARLLNFIYHSCKILYIEASLSR